MVLNIKQIGDRRGHLSVLENNNKFPFKIKRVFYIYDIPSGESRGAHAHKNCHQFLIAASGGFQVKVSDGKSEKTFSLMRPNQGLHIPPGLWASELNFTSCATCLVLASDTYKEEDYIRNFDDYLSYLKSLN